VKALDHLDIEPGASGKEAQAYHPYAFDRE